MRRTCASEHVAMDDDAVQSSRRARKRTSRSENDASASKRARVNGFVAEEPEPEVSTDIRSDEFDGRFLRSLLSSSSGLGSLRKFLTICSENEERDLAGEYLLAGGGVLEVLRLLDFSDKKSTSNAVTVFSAVNILLMKILTKYPQCQNSAVEACRHLLNSYMSIVHSMLSTQSNVKQRKIVLKLLTAVVSLNNSLARELLAHLSLQRNVLESLVQHTKPADPQNIRTCFIHFILAFLVEGDSSVIKTLLDKHSLFTCIFSDLLYDSKDIVTLILTTVKTYVLENSSITKTMKLHVFSTSVVLNLISLYNWKGPTNWPKNKTHYSGENNSFLADKEAVNDTIHAFLITLLTSHRYGIIFHDRTLGSRNKHNQLVYTVLQSLEKPWEHEKPSDLVIKIMRACPDLIRSQYVAVEPFLEPRVSSKWICLLRFVKKVIESLDPVNCIKTCTAELNANRLTNTLLSLTIPDIIIKNAILPGLSHDSLFVRHETLSLLLAMTSQLKIVCSTLKDFHRTFVVQNQITDFILKIIPNLETILKVWHQAFEADVNTINSESTENIHNPDLLDHLELILNVLHSYKDICPELLDNSMNLQPNVLLSSLNDLQDGEEEDGGAKLKKINCMKVKAIQFLLVLDSSIFAPREKVFKEALPFLISLIHQTDSSLESYEDATKNAIRMLLNATSLFESCDDQFDIWIDGFSMITDPKEIEELTHWFMSILKSCIKHTDKYINSITQAEEILLNDQVVSLDVKAKDVINELFDKANKNPSPCEKEFVTADSSSINGELNVDAKRDDTVNSLDKLNKEDSKVTITHTNNYRVQRNEQIINLEEVKKMENEIDRLLEKINPNSFSNINDHSLSLKKIVSASGTASIDEFANFDRKKTDDVTDHLSDQFSNENLNPYKMQTCTLVSPLLCCALEKTRVKNHSAIILNYLSYVTIHTFHHQIVPDVLVHMTTDLIDLPIYNYLQSWSRNGQPVPLKNKLPSLKLLRKLGSALLKDSEVDIIKFFKLFGGELSCCFKYADEEVTVNHSLSSHDVKVLLKTTVFYLAQLAQRGLLQRIQNENCKVLLISLLNIAQSINGNRMFVENVKCIFTHPILLHYFSPFCGEASKDSTEDMITRTILEVCQVVASFFEKHDDATETYNIFFAFRNKFLARLRNIEKDPLEVSDNNYALAFLKVLQLSAQEISSLLLALTKLEKIVFISNDKQSLSVVGHVVPTLLDMYCSKVSKLQRNQYNELNEQFLERFSLHLVYIKSNKIQCTDRWEQALAKYLSMFPCNIADVSNITWKHGQFISTETFALLLTKGIAASTIHLIAILIVKNIRLIPSLMKYLLKSENMKRGDIVFPILGGNLKYKWTEKFLQSLYKSFGDDIAAYLTEPQNPVPWIEENASAIAYLIENTFDRPLCKKTCISISQNGDKLDMVPVHFVQLLASLYKRYESLMTVKEKPLTDLLLVLLHVMTSTLKRESKNKEKIRVLCEKLDGTVLCLRKIKRDFNFSSLSKSYSWPQFTRFSLKLGLKDAKDDEIQSSVLKSLSNLCDIAYEDNENDEYAKTLFEMTTSHSEFVNVMLSSSIVKDNLVELLRILIRKNESVINVSHVPLYLAAYSATLSHADQRILKILRYYEAHGVKLQQYWPYLWGNAAATRYSVKGETDTVLWRQPSTSEIFNLFDKDIVNETIRNYPIHRTLEADELQDNTKVYDPAFYLPLLCSLLAENNVIACHKINQSGALALVFAACCSDSSGIRMAAYTVISRYYFHLEASKSKEKLLWMRLIDALRNGIVLLKCPLKDVSLSCLVTTFLARASLIASQPLHPLYSSLHSFLMAKPALDVNTIPELLQLLHSSHVEHKAHRHWILQTIRDGMRKKGDVDLALKCVLFRMLLDFYTCILSDSKTKKLILEVIVSTTKIPKASLLLIRGYGILPWLYEIIHRDGEVYETKSGAINSIIENLLNSLDNSTEDVIHYKFLLFSILLRLKTYLKDKYKVCRVI
ncbi:nucleolar pre-ribosomal-associated protein 1 [Nylanderia fulva]|uniref:nucleolar pre-ribosomal-associated protein 1 n=1 Tax=Nylanderia fulva TaxID=613905 RepID=UPI0010FB4387|nr:nucleolar pre-ribosomal-associated protein 1 [Nylanderia fulva]